MQGLLVFFEKSLTIYIRYLKFGVGGLNAGSIGGIGLQAGIILSRIGITIGQYRGLKTPQC